MSYILDALRRADSERERGAIPSLHSKPVPPALADADEEGGVASSGRRLMWGAIGASVVMAAVVVWLLLGRGERQDAAPMPMVAVAPPPATPYVPPAQPVSPAPADTSAQLPAAPPQPVPQPVHTVSPAPVAAPARPTTVAARPAEHKDAAKPAAKAAKPAPSDDEADAPVPSMAALPDNIRRELPPLTVSGATYSKTASSRMLILNGQVFHEGDKVASELTLEQIRLKSAVFSYRGHRFGLNF